MLEPTAPLPDGGLAAFPALPHDRAARRKSAMLRVVIAVAATIELLYFYVELPFPLHKMINFSGRWFDILSGLCMAAVAPLIALAALAVAATSQRFSLAGILLAVAPAVYWPPMLAFAVANLIRGV